MSSGVALISTPALQFKIAQLQVPDCDSEMDDISKTW